MVNETLRPRALPVVGRDTDSLGHSARGRGYALRFPRISRLKVY
jgi:hypothetical protein